MNTSRAKVSNYRAAPRKIRLIADFVRGKEVKKALAELKFLNKRHAEAVIKCIESALANAQNTNKSTDNLAITDIQVQEGKTLKRMRPGSLGRGLPLRKRMSHIEVTLGEKAPKKAKTATKKK